MVQAKDGRNVTCWRCRGESASGRMYKAQHEPGSGTFYWTKGVCECQFPEVAAELAAERAQEVANGSRRTA